MGLRGRDKYIIYPVTELRAWRNGRRYGLKIRWPYGRGGSSPPARTTLSLETSCYPILILWIT